MSELDLRKLFKPKSVAVVGASADPDKIRGKILQVLMRLGFPGAIYPITRSHRSINGLPCYPRADELPEAPDLAIIVVPAEVASPGPRGLRPPGYSHRSHHQLGLRRARR